MLDCIRAKYLPFLEISSLMTHAVPSALQPDIPLFPPEQ